MNSYQPGGWGKRLLSALVLLLAIAVAARVVYDLLSPLLPTVLVLVGLSALTLFIVRRRLG